MKLGFITALLETYSYEQVLDFVEDSFCTY